MFAISMLKYVKLCDVRHVNFKHLLLFTNTGTVFDNQKDDSMRDPNADSITQSPMRIAHGWNSKSSGTLECAPSS